MFGLSEDLESIGFIVGERAVAIHGRGLKNFDDDYVSNLDPAFWLEALSVFHNKPEGEKMTSNEATVLRIAVSQNLESVLALLFATLQSPMCITGWLSFYKVEDIRILSNKVLSGEHFPNRFNLDTCDLDSVVSVLWRNLGDQDKSMYKESLKELLKYFLTPLVTDEYNALKHGFRTSQQSLSVSFSPSMSSENPPTTEDFIPMGEAKRGSSFLSTKKENRFNYKVEWKHVNWDMKVLSYMATHTALTGNNILWSLQRMRSITSEIKPRSLVNETHYKVPKEKGNDIISIIATTDFKIQPQILYTEERIQKMYK